jgi:hypothetical protein
MKTYYVDGGAFIEPPNYKFHDAYFSVVNEKGKLIHFEEVGDIYSGLAEYLAIAWVVKNRKTRPLRITSDCQTAIAWATHSTKKSRKRKLVPLDLIGVHLEYEHENLADCWNAQNHSPKKSKSFYVRRWINSRKRDFQHTVSP